ncbi:hypothetical protein [Chitinophaga barathri]|uniref:Outer membrane protein beta-barrel domain-containing protein n=1 Tax=Chitinophaga barathri TaxID=1647451 RepID=A0A3N4MFT5_9BACT|nr:hypothetical protein [Chitinophaga barathri]RPD42468.1 hypothetical protein EG028_04645 [Chitinophaga barathri]
MLTAGFFLLTGTVQAQRLDAIGNSQPVKVTGGVGLDQVLYFASGQEGRRDPYNFFLNGNINFDIYGWSVPFSFSYSNQGRVSFSQPFNQYGLTPTYKWITGHLGYSSMNFSGYTLGGHMFNGVGVDLAPPGNFKVSAMYGRLQRGVAADTLNRSIEPAYKRMGYGVKVSYGAKKDNLDLIIFRAKDEANSIPPLSEGYTLTPQDNLALGLNFSKQLFGRLLVTGEIATSTLTRDTRAVKDSGTSVKVPTLGLLQKNSTTALYHAYKTGISYSGRGYAIGLGYEWVAPEYKTLGAYYFTNDFENITANVQFQALQQKLTANVNGGVQRNNLHNDKLSTMRRWVGALNLNYVASKKLNLSFSYSNFQAYVNIRSDFDYINQVTPYENLDTLNYTQISQNASLSANYNISRTKDKSQVLSTNVSMMKSADMQGGVKQNTGVTFYNLNMMYSVQLVPRNMSVNFGLNANRNNSANLSSTTFGPTLGANKSFLDKKLRSSGSVSWNGSFANGQNVNKVLTARVTNAYTVKKSHSFNLSIAMINRQAVTRGNSRNMNELTSTLGYNYNF